jgi:hypothetical protein
MDVAIGLRLDMTFQAYLLACRRLRTEREADRLLDLLIGIVDPTLRLHRFGEHLRSRSVEETAWIFARLRARVTDGDVRAQGIGFGLLDRGRLEQVLSPAHLTAAAEALRRRGHPGAALFADAPRRENPPEDGVLPRPTEPIGYRISLARRAIAGAVERLLFDPDPRVVRALLGNPRVTEAEVIKLAASRRAGPQALVIVAQDDRWIARYPVKVALANNPATPVRIALGLLPFLMRQDLRALSASDPRGEVRSQASALLLRQAGPEFGSGD